MKIKMSSLLQKLADWGCDVDGAMRRFLGEEELYHSCLRTVINDKAFGALGEALASGDTREAFNHAHTLKGVLANMGLTPMFDIVVKIVEPLRAGQNTDLMPYYQELLAANEKLKLLLEAV